MNIMSRENYFRLQFHVRIAVIIATFWIVDVARAVTYRTVALEGQLAPGTIGDTRFGTFGIVLINNAGQT